MASYEVEHNIASAPPRSSNRRPDLSTFFSTLELVDTSGEQRAHNNNYATPAPADVSAVFRTLAEALEQMRQGDNNDVMQRMLDSLMSLADAPPKEVKGVSQAFLDELERIPNKSLKKTDTCPICNNPFLEDQYPLVVRLPCHDSHRFDLECIQPWLKLQSTCPLDRIDLLKKKEPPPPTPADEEEEVWDDMYA